MSFPIECAYNLWRTRNVLLQMLEYRKYKKDSIVCLDTGVAVESKEYSWEEWCDSFYEELKDHEEKSQSLMDVEKYYEIREKMSLTCLTGKDKKVLILWYPGSKLGIKNAGTLGQRLKEYDMCILIHNSKISPDAKLYFKTIEYGGKVLDIFTDEELFINKTKHPLVPRHIICSEKTKEDIYTLYSIRQEEDEYPGLPLMLHTDCICKFIGARPGQLVKIVRPSYTQILPSGKRGTSISYRCVI